jgi:hypothetical protein
VVKKHKDISKIPSTNELNNWASKTLSILFPEYPEEELSSM